MRTRLWTRWDTVTLLAYEALALPIAFFVHGDWQFPAFVIGLLALVVVTLPLLKHTERGARLRASVPRGRRSAPWSLTIMAAVVVMVAISLAMHGLGAGQSDGWLIVAVGAINPTVNVANRWWTARAGTAG